MKQGLELTLNTLIVATVALVTMVVIIAIFMGGAGGIKEFIMKMIGQTSTNYDCMPTGPGDDADNDGLSDSKKYMNKEKQEVQCDTDKTVKPSPAPRR